MICRVISRVLDTGGDILDPGADLPDPGGDLPDPDSTLEIRRDLAQNKPYPDPIFGHNSDTDTDHSKNVCISIGNGETWIRFY